MSNVEPLTESKKKVYTVPEGEYLGVWQNNFVWISDQFKKVFARIETKKSTKRKQNVKIIINVCNVKVYAR